MIPVSVVIITNNEADILASCLNAAILISDDIIIIDNNSTDKTLLIARIYGCRIYNETWDGYGANKNKGIAYAKYDWILSIDADEVVDMSLIGALHGLVLNNPDIVYDIPFKTYFEKKLIRYGTWGRDHHIRLFNRKTVKWTETPVHECLILPKNVSVKKLVGHIHHYSVKDEEEFSNKALHYAVLSARKYAANNKKPTLLKLYIAPIFHFIKNYIVLLGFMDGREGFTIAKMIAKQTKLKYHLLKHQPKHHHEKTAKEEENLMMVEY